MARNRKYQSAAVRFGPALKALVLCLMVGGSGVGYVWQKNQIVELGKQKTERERRLSVLEDESKKLQNQLESIRARPSMTLRAKALGLSAPLSSQVITLTEPARNSGRLTAERSKQQDMALR